jgi:hypothetical protein
MIISILPRATDPYDDWPDTHLKLRKLQEIGLARTSDVNRSAVAATTDGKISRSRGFISLRLQPQ